MNYLVEPSESDSTGDVGRFFALVCLRAGFSAVLVVLKNKNMHFIVIC